MNSKLETKLGLKIMFEHMYPRKKKLCIYTHIYPLLISYLKKFSWKTSMYGSFLSSSNQSYFLFSSRTKISRNFSVIWLYVPFLSHLAVRPMYKIILHKCMSRDVLPCFVVRFPGSLESSA